MQFSLSFIISLLFFLFNSIQYETHFNCNYKKKNNYYSIFIYTYIYMYVREYIRMYFQQVNG